MSMLTAQCDKLREMASRLEWEGFPLPDVTSLLRDAADTIESLRGRLTEQTCLNVADPPEEGFLQHFKCSVCGAYYVMDEYAYYCPECGRKVVG